MLKRILQSVFGHQPVPSDVLQDIQDYKELLKDKDVKIAQLENKLAAMQYDINYMVSHPTVKEVPVDHFTFTPESYRKFKRSLETPVCTANTSPTQAAYFLGICRVLTELEDKHVTSR